MTRWLPWALLAGLSVGAAAYLRSAGDGVIEAWDDEVAALVRDNAELGRRLADELRRSPGSHVVGSATATTGTVTAHGRPRPVQCPQTAPSGPTSSGDRTGVVATPAAAPASPLCLLADGDGVELRVGQVAIDHRRSADLTLVGALSAWRLTPEPATEIAIGTFSTRLDLPEPSARWGVGAAVLGSWDGVAPAVAVAAPPLRLLGWSLEATAALGWGTSGPAASATVIVRP